jgi:hypothetical protein
MTKTISRTRLQRGTQSTRTREIVAGDSTTPRRHRLSAAGPSRANRPSDPGELRNRPLTTASDPDRDAMQRTSRGHKRLAPAETEVAAERAAVARPRSRSRASDDDVAPTKTRPRTRTAAIGAVEPGREGIAASLGNTDVRGPSTGGRAARERSKIASVRDGRYGRTRSRFIV